MFRTFRSVLPRFRGIGCSDVRIFVELIIFTHVGFNPGTPRLLIVDQTIYIYIFDHHAYPFNSIPGLKQTLNCYNCLINLQISQEYVYVKCNASDIAFGSQWRSYIDPE